MRSIIPFLLQLKENNNRDWFLANKKQYETAKKELEAFLEEVISGIAAFDQGIAGLTPKDCIYRINRDIRFSNDKTPYKINMGAVIAPGGRKSKLGCYYVHIEPGGSFLAGGIYMPEPDMLRNIRQEMDYNLEELEGILQAPAFTRHFTGLDNYKLKTVPKGYTSDNPAIEYLKNKNFTVSCLLKDEAVAKKDFPGKALEIFQAMQPLNAFLNRAVETA